MPTLRGERVNAINGKQMDKVRKEIHVVSVTNPHLETDAVVDEKNSRPLLLLKRRNRLTGRYNLWHLPCVTSTSLNPDAHMVKNVSSDTLRLMISPAKSKKGGAKGFRCLIEGVHKIRLCLSQVSYEKTCSTERVKNWEQITPSSSPR